MAKQLTNLSSDGMVFGQSVSDKIGFYGLTTAIAQQTLSAGVATSSATTITSLNQVISALGALGLVRAT